MGNVQERSQKKLEGGQNYNRPKITMIAVIYENILSTFQIRLGQKRDGRKKRDKNGQATVQQFKAKHVMNKLLPFFSELEISFLTFL